ncbi:MAG: 4-hydroxy-tetrahydrodipicolinate synthase [Rhodospirillales bacterium]|nr:4-hydroxy-tetrahydrodipicolinate synthase [Rhodospirillales bacterium]
MFMGSIPALMTPMKDGKVDDNAFQSFVEWQIAEGSNGLVPCGTTGESPTLTHQEHMHVTEMCMEVATGKVPVIAGIGHNSTHETILFGQHAKKIGADAGLVVTPYYNKPTQEGIFQHFKAVHDAIDLPIIVYNVPGRSVVDISVETMARLATLPNIVGVKDATADLARPQLTSAAIKTPFCLLTGEDASAVPYLAGGGVGCISVTANVAPRLCSDMQRAWREGDLAKTMEIQEILTPLHDAMFCETSPGPVKYAAKLLGLCTGELRLPMVDISEDSKATVEAALRSAGLLN